MFVPALSLDEENRLAALYACEILDTLPESAFEDLVELAQRVCATPAAAITFIDSDRQWVKAGRGMGDASSIPRQHAFCNYTIGRSSPLVVPDAQQDERFVNNPFVTADGGVRFYAGVPLVVGDGAHVGTLCVLDRAPRTLDAVAQSTLELLARQVASQLELRRQRVALQDALAQKESELRRISLAYALQQCMADAGDLMAGCARAVPIIAEALGFVAGAVWRVERGSSALINVGGYWTKSPAQQPFADASLATYFAPDVGLPGAVWRSGATIWLPDLLSEPQVPRLTAALASGVVAGVGFPLLQDGQVVVVLEFFGAQANDQGDAVRDLLALAVAELSKALGRLG